jgi:hypothetical protein
LNAAEKTNHLEFFFSKKKKEFGKNIFNLRLSWRRAEILLPAIGSRTGESHPPFRSRDFDVSGY